MLGEKAADPKAFLSPLSLLGFIINTNKNKYFISFS